MKTRNKISTIFLNKNGNIILIYFRYDKDYFE